MKEGTKYDKGKLRLSEMFIDFKIAMKELCRVWEFGANKYEKSNWKKLDNPVDRYTNAMLRHLIAEDDNLVDDESGLLHAAHIAFNALARLHFILLGTIPKNHTVIQKGLYSIPKGKAVTYDDIHDAVMEHYASPPISIDPDCIDARPGSITPMEWSEGGVNG